MCIRDSLGILAVCVLTGVLVAAVSGRVRSWKAGKAAVQAAAMQESMSASAAEAESLAACLLYTSRCV